MLHFLPKENKKKVVTEYILRNAIFLFIFTAISVCVLIFLFLPSMFFSQLRSQTISNQLKSVEQTGTINSKDTVTLIKNINITVKALSDQMSYIPLSSVIQGIIFLKNNDIKISGISITVNADNTKNVTITGSSNTRDSLTLFNQNLRADDSFSNVTLPISTFIKDTNISFTMTLNAK